MGKRLSKIYTRTGDKGETGLGDGSRISKTAPRVEAMGSVDELNSIVGVVVEELLASNQPEGGVERIRVRIEAGFDSEAG